jgi:pilus assembly protein Flp/PilA
VNTEVQDLLNTICGRLLVVRREEGQAMAEYGIILALIAVIVIGTVAALGLDIRGAFQSIVNGI